MHKQIRICEPQTPLEFEAYFSTRYQTLRAPWGQPPGSERDDQEISSVHAMAVNEHGEVLGVCRLQFNSEEEAQLRYMGIQEQARGLGIGRMLIDFMETRAKQHGARSMVLQARENAVAFYEKCGYRVIEKSYLMWDSIQHFKMEKNW